MGPSTLEAQRICAVALVARLAPGHLPSGEASERGLEVHVHRVLLRTHWLQRRMDVHHQLHAQNLAKSECCQVNIDG